MDKMSKFNIFVYRNGWCMLEGHLARHTPFSEGEVSRLRQASYSNVAAIHQANCESMFALRPRLQTQFKQQQVHHQSPPSPPPSSPSLPSPRSSVRLMLMLMLHLLIDTCILVTKVLYLADHMPHRHTCRKNVCMRCILWTQQESKSPQNSLWTRLLKI